MFLESHSIIYDHQNRNIDLSDMNNLPGWKKIGEWEISADGLYMTVNVGWMAMFNNHYMVFLGQYEGLKIQNLGMHFNKNKLPSGGLEDFPIYDIEKWNGPVPDLSENICIIL